MKSTLGKVLSWFQHWRDRPNEENAPSTVRRTLNAGREIAVGGAGAWIGALVSDPFGAFVGGAGGTALSQLLYVVTEEIGSRTLGHRQRVRVGATLIFARQRIQERLNNGDVPRADDFFEADITNRSAAGEIAEAVLLVAQHEHQERKIEALGRLLANLAFDGTVNRDYANVLVKLAEQLSYRQLCFLYVVGQLNRTQRQAISRGKILETSERTSTHHEILELYSLGLVDMIADEQLYLRKTINLLFSSVTPVAKDLIRSMELSLLPKDDISEAEELITKIQYYDF